MHPLRAFLSLWLAVAVIALEAQTVPAIQQSRIEEKTQGKMQNLDRWETQVTKAVGRESAAADRKAVEQAVQSIAKKGTSQPDAELLAGWSWVWIRLGSEKVPTSQPIDAKRVEVKAAALGKIVINSEPDQAEATIENQLLPKPTNTHGYAEPGKRTVRVIAPGYAPAEQVCDVKSISSVIFTAKLDPKRSTATCR